MCHFFDHSVFFVLRTPFTRSKTSIPSALSVDTFYCLIRANPRFPSENLLTANAFVNAHLDSVQKCRLCVCLFNFSLAQLTHMKRNLEA